MVNGIRLVQPPLREAFLFALDNVTQTQSKFYNVKDLLAVWYRLSGLSFSVLFITDE